MFVLNETHQYDWPVRVEVPQNGGTFATERFTARFLVMPKERAEEVVMSGADDDFLAEVLVGWNEDEVGIDDGSGNRQSLPFTPANRDRLLRNPYVRRGVFAAYLESVGGRREKN